MKPQILPRRLAVSSRLPGALLCGLLAAITGATSAQPAPRGAEPATVRAQEGVRQQLPFADRQDFEDAHRGFIARRDAPVLDANGRTVWDPRAYAFEAAEEAPPTVNPSLWRQARLDNEAGLFQVTARMYQVRGMDLANMTIVEGDTGLIVIDPLLSMETAQAALDLYYQHRPRKPVLAVIYTHSHVDHFGGAKGVASAADVAAGRVQVIAPEGFLEEAVSENVMAGTAMSRRAQYMYGALLTPGAAGQVDAGLGKGISHGTVTLIAPTEYVRQSGTRRIDGIDIEFQLTPGTEAPAEMNLYFPQLRVLDIAENAVHTQHNLLTLRGAKVRDAKTWSCYLGQTLAAYGNRTDILVGQHHWPTWGRERVVQLLADQRDMYEYLNDQALRLINLGLTPLQIADRLRSLPAGLANRWYARDYYGSVSQNVRAVYQRYLGFYDGNPAHLNPLPPEDAAKNTIAWMGGADAVVAKARASFAQGDYRWVAQVLDQVVFADPANSAARELEADALEQLGYQAENSTWRNAYLTGAQELRRGVHVPPGGGSASADLVQALTVPMFFDYLGVRLDADRAAGKELAIDWDFADLHERYAMTLRNSALTYIANARSPKPDAQLHLSKSVLDRIATGQLAPRDAIAQGAIQVEGNPRAVATLFGMLDRFTPDFPIVTPAHVRGRQ